MANEEDKDSEEPVEDDEGDDKSQEDDEQEERRPLLIPKIYIKKPPVTKEVLLSHVNTGSKDPVKMQEIPLVEKEQKMESQTSVAIPILQMKEFVANKNVNNIGEKVTEGKLFSYELCSYKNHYLRY